MAAACERREPLRGTTESAEALAGQVLAGLADRNEAALRRLALDEREFRDHVWPNLPAARPERNLPFGFVWGDLHQKSEASLRKLLAEHGGHRYQLVSVRFEGPTNQYGDYRVHRETTLQVRDEGGADQDLRVFGSSLEKDGAWKVFSYVIAD